VSSQGGVVYDCSFPVYRSNEWDTYSESVFLALGISIQSACAVIYCLSWLIRLIVFFHLNFLDRFSKNLQISISWKSVQWEPSCCKRTDGQTERQTDGYDETNSPSSQFWEGAYKTVQFAKQRIVPSVLYILAFTHSFLHRLLWLAYLNVGNDTNYHYIRHLVCRFRSSLIIL